MMCPRKRCSASVLDCFSIESFRQEGPPHDCGGYFHMSPVQSSPPSDPAPGGLLYELERRQDDVLAQLDELDAQVKELLSSLGVRSEENDTDSAETSTLTEQ
ncbi:MAG: hypothetical protein WD119_03015 [Pirellulaceae bacterium]